jgi:heme a synthase
MLDSFDSGNFGANNPITKITPLALIRKLIIVMAIATLFLMALGSATRVMNAGLSCPDWPLCYGEFVPREQMNLQVFLEWFHRLIATSMGLVTLVLTGLTLWYRRSLPQWLPWFGLTALILVIAQGVLGALTVTELLRFDIVTAHLGTGLLFFATLTAGACALQPYKALGKSRGLTWLSLASAVVIYAQSILGGLVSTQWALSQCLANSDRLCTVMNNHLFGVIPVCTLVLAVGIGGGLSKSLDSLSKNLSFVAVGLLFLQAVIGVSTYRLHLQVEPLTVAHQSVGALLLGTMIALTVLGFRRQNSASLVPTIALNNQNL